MYKPLLATACAALLLAACGDRTQAVVAAASPDTPQPARNFMLFFGNDHANVTPESEAVIQEAVRAARANPNARITVSGNADTYRQQRLQPGPVAEAGRSGPRRPGEGRHQPGHDRGGRPRRGCAAGLDQGRCPRAEEPARRDHRPVEPSARFDGVLVLQEVGQGARETERQAQPEEAGDQSSGNRSHAPENLSRRELAPAPDAGK